MAMALWMVPLLLAIAAFPRWAYSREWGYLPAAGLAGIALLILLFRMLYVI